MWDQVTKIDLPWLIPLLEMLLTPVQARFAIRDRLRQQIYICNLRKSKRRW